ncbi:unnamed protein product (macronuclear) [Paramecium tetraurelia]|uniref:Uncharacterized protein n=1 Tax=Paramecium tetraurelia TaxID=5888 RepID=A0EFX8_PARTE|nr:uncharacterized protein GSPATT00026542001 [Paramecium tetraurelia]CAK94219.1 unnamed protein product [Paramecium tetraurelia]|eukprot:XP_001461592.1 hypothetical protein (macronuclear) [Paramecium tetraurelia strain d4-2]
MGACHTKRSRRQSKEWRFCERLTSQRLDFIFQRLSLYLELVGDTHSLGGYLQEKINELFQIKQKLTLVKDHIQKIELLYQASDVIEYLYDDKHFSQAFPILRESLYEITQLTLVTQ